MGSSSSSFSFDRTMQGGKRKLLNNTALFFFIPVYFPKSNKLYWYIVLNDKNYISLPNVTTNYWANEIDSIYVQRHSIPFNGKNKVFFVMHNYISSFNEDAETTIWFKHDVISPVLGEKGFELTVVDTIRLECFSIITDENTKELCSSDVSFEKSKLMLVEAFIHSPQNYATNSSKQAKIDEDDYIMKKKNALIVEAILNDFLSTIDVIPRIITNTTIL